MIVVLAGIAYTLVLMNAMLPMDSEVAPPKSVWGGRLRLKIAWRARLIAALAVPCILGLTAWQIWSSYQNVIDNSEAMAVALARVAEEHFAGTMRSIDQVLVESIGVAYSNDAVDTGKFEGIMQSRKVQFSYIRNAFIVDSGGTIITGTSGAFTGINVNDRDYFVNLSSDSKRDLFISVPLKSRVGDLPSIFVARAVRDAAGAFRGLTVIAVDPKIFDDELRSVQPDHGGFATLLRSDGIILSRVPDGAVLAGKVVADGPVMTMAAEASNGVIRGRGAVDGADRILAFRRLENYPLVVVVGTRMAQVLTAWRSEASIHFGVGLVLSMLMAAMAAFSDYSQSQRQLAQKALASSEARYRLLNDRSPLGIVQAETDGSTVYANDRWLELVGRSRDQVMGAKWCDAVVDEDRPAVLKGWIKMIRHGGVFSAEMRVMSSGGVIRWLRGYASLLDESQGGVGLVATFEDITSARQVEQNLRLSEEKFAKAFLGSPDALVISTQTTGKYVEVNTAFCRLLGYERDELMGTDALTRGVWGNPEDRNRLVEIIARDGQVEDFETVLRRKDGVTMIVLISVQQIMVGGDPCLLFICRDISERRAMEERTRTLLVKLDASNKELEQFAYVASHDLQEPLRMIAGYAQLLERRYRGRLDSDADEFIAFLVDGAKRMQIMIRDLLEYSRVGRLGGAFVRFNGDEALDEVRRNLMAAIEEADAAVHMGPMPEIVADRSQFVRLLQNLIGNALKYRHMDRKPDIWVSVEKVGTDWQFSVTDNGIGIDPQYFERIFLVFQRLHTRDKFEGTGIGLAICKKIVERHGGRLWVEALPEGGCIFRFSLPVDAAVF